MAHGTLDRHTLERLAEMLRGRYHLPATLPSRIYDLAMRLDQPAVATDGPGEVPGEQRLPPPSKESDYRRQAVETMRLAQQTSSPTVKARLVNLAEAWIELAERAHKGRSDHS
jgi:hypothetical protein